MPFRYLLDKASNRSDTAEHLYHWMSGLDTRVIEAWALIFCGLLRGAIWLLPYRSFDDTPKVYSMLPFTETAWGALLYSLAVVHILVWLWGLPLRGHTVRWKRRHVSLRLRYGCVTLWALTSAFMGLCMFRADPFVLGWVWQLMVLGCAVVAHFHLSLVLSNEARKRKLSAETDTHFDTVHRVWERESQQRQYVTCRTDRASANVKRAGTV